MTQFVPLEMCNLVFTLFPMLRFDPHTVSSVPPAAGPSTGSTLLISGTAILNPLLETAIPEGSVMFMKNIPTKLPLVVVQRICFPGMKLPASSIGTQGTSPITMLFDVKSSYVTPRSLPVMVMVVPPSIGPDLGIKSVMTGEGQPDPSIIGATSHAPT